MLETWTLTVLGLMNSCLPISPLAAALGDQRQDLGLARGERVRRGSAALGVLPSALQVVEQRLRAERVGGRAGQVGELAGAGGVAGGAQDPGQRRRATAASS